MHAYNCYYYYFLVVALGTAAIASVCPNEQLILTCQARPDEVLLQWSLRFPGRSQAEDRYISSEGSANRAPNLNVMGNTSFQFLRISTSPLISMMVIDNVSSSLNGTRVDCIYGHEMMSTDTINVITNGTSNSNYLS